MDRMLKVFANKKERETLTKDHPPLVEYDAFVVIQASQKVADTLAAKFPLEDITDQYLIPLETKEIKTPQRAVQGKTRALANQGIRSPDNKPHHYLVQFIGPIKNQWLKGVAKAGGELREPYGGFAYVVRADQSELDAIRVLPYVRWVGHLPHNQRVERSVEAPGESATLPRTRVLTGAFVVDFFGADDAKRAKPAVKKIGFEILAADLVNGQLTVYSSKNKAQRQKMVRELSAVHGVRMVRERTADRTSNDVATGIMAAKVTSNPAGPGLDGSGEVIAVCDTGLDTGDLNTIHPDFAGRIALIKSYPLTPMLNPFVRNPGADDGPADLDSGHGTHVAGSVLGSGAVSKGIPGVVRPIRGLAHNAKLVFQAIEQETKWKSAADLREQGRYGLWGIPDNLKGLFNDAYKAKARIHSNSWGGGKPGEYDEQCRQLDEFVWEKKDFLVIVAAGNDGTDKDGDGKINLMSVTSPGTAKNCLTVGASENSRTEFDDEHYGDWWPDDYPVAPHQKNSMADKNDEIAAFSSRGPTKDNRTKPEVVAPGTFILSTRSSQIAANNSAWSAYPPSKRYFYMGGTSMATPLVAGAAALVRQYLKDKQGIAKPSAALVKAALIAGATRLKGTAPAGAVCDNHQGFGRIDLDAILSPPATLKARFIEQKSGLTTGKIKSHPVKVKSSAMSLKIVMVYSDFPGPNLVNNLNLIVTNPTGKQFTANPSANGGAMQLDTTNNVEVINIPAPEAGSWRVDVIGSNIAHGPQDYALVVVESLRDSTTTTTRQASTS